MNVSTTRVVLTSGQSGEHPASMSDSTTKKK